MARRIVILGGGTGGTLIANRLRKSFDQARSRSPSSTRTTGTSTNPVCCSSRSASRSIDDIVRPRHRQLHKGISFHESDIDHVATSTTTRCISPTAPCSPTTC